MLQKQAICLPAFLKGPTKGASSTAKEFAGDHNALNLTGSFADLGELRIPQHPFHHIVGNVPVTSVNLYRLVGDERRHLARIQLRHRGFLLEGQSATSEKH